MRRNVLASLLLAILISAPALGAQSTAPARGASAEGARARVQARLDELHARADFPGATVGFVLPDGTSGAVSAGLADVEAKRALRPGDRMLAGSIGKTYFAAVAMQLVEEGKLDLDAKVEHWLGREAWFRRLPNARAVTVRMLLNHTSGVPEHVAVPEFLAAALASPDRVWTPPELVAYVLDREPLFEAGRGWGYADTNYIVLGMALERITKRPLYEEVERRLLGPLRLGDTLPAVSRTIPGLVPGYSRPKSPFGFEGRTIVDGKFVLNPQLEWTGGGFVSTAEDLARWAAALYGGRVLKAATLATMVEGVAAKTGPGDRYGLGVQVRQSEWGVSYGHGGWFPGYLSEMEYFPRERTAVAIQFNTDRMQGLGRPPRAYVAEIMRVLTAVD